MFSFAFPSSARPSSRTIHNLGFLTLLAAIIAIGLPAAALGQAPSVAQLSRSYITPFPAGNQYRIVVLGDSLGDGIWAGLYRVFKEDPNMEVVKKSRVSTGFTRTDYFDWNANIKAILQQEPAHIAVIMVGANDLQSIFAQKRWYKLGSEKWRQIYGDRVDKFIRQLKGANAAVYWVGLPIMRSEANNQNMQVMNEIFREKAFLNGVKFIDTWNGFADEFGRYSAYGPDLTGQVRRLRASDGIHFTMSGYVKLAHFVEREIRRDLRVSKAERNIPLAGSEEEQARAIRHARPSQPGAKATRSAAEARQEEPGQAADASQPARERPAGTQIAVLAPTINKAAKEIPGVQLVRPPLPDTAAESSPADYAPPGESIAHNLNFGLTALGTISPMNDPNLLAGPQQLPLTERPYYRVFIQGEQLKPKAGRADDFSWPES